MTFPYIKYIVLIANEKKINNLFFNKVLKNFNESKKDIELFINRKKQRANLKFFSQWNEVLIYWRFFYWSIFSWKIFIS